MKRIRISLITVLAFMFALAQAPSQANCQILSFVSTAQCAMPCCQHLSRSMPTSCKCHKLKTAPPLDTITPHANIVRRVLMDVASLPTLLAQNTVQTFSRIPGAADVFNLLFIEQPPLGRAPPSDITLLSA